MRCRSKPKCEEGMVMVISLVFLAVVSVIWLSLSISLLNTQITIVRMFKRVEEFYRSRMDLQNLMTIAVDEISKDPNWTGSSISGNLRELLESWKAFLNRKYHDLEAEEWRELADSLTEGKFLDISDITRKLSDVFEGEVLKAAVFRKEEGNMVVELVLVESDGEFAWGLIPKEKYTPLNRYMFFTNVQGRIYFVTGDVIRGPVVINDTLYIWGDPVFKGDVVVRDIEIREGNPVFENGYTIMDEDSEVFELTDEYADDVIGDYRSLTEDVTKIRNGYSGGIYFHRSSLRRSGIRPANSIRITGDCDGNCKIEFEIDGRRLYELEYDPNSSPKAYAAVLRRFDKRGREVAEFRMTFNGLILVDDSMTLYVSRPSRTSYFSGLITIASEGTMYIDGNVVYGYLKRGNSFITNTESYNEISKDHPLDLLNLVAREDVIMTRNVPRNLYITASIYALTGMFTLDGYRYVRKDTLHVFGSIVQYQRGPIGTFRVVWRKTHCCDWGESGCCGDDEVEYCWGAWLWRWCCCYRRETESVSGFLKDYTYDERLYNPLIRPVANPSMGRGEGDESQISIIDLR